MTREEREEALDVLTDMANALHLIPTTRQGKVFKMVLQELQKQEPCNDAISRQAVKNIIRGGVCTDTEADIEYVCGLIDGLPSVATSEKVGQWIPTGYDGYADGNPVYDWWECSECGGEHSGDEESLTAFCPNCGAKMQEVKE